MDGKRPPSNNVAPSLADGLSSNESNKKIKRSFFKEDVSVKSYKCDVTGQDIATSAKLYISNRAFYVVHRPKRRKLTTMPFTEINNVKARSDGQGVDVFLANDSIYAFTRFQRPESAVAFLLNFWNMIRKEKFVFRHGQMSSIADLSSSGGTGLQSNSGSSITPESLRIPKIPTTISLNSSASISESDSADSRRQDINSTSSDHSHPSTSAEMHSGDNKTSSRCENLTRSALSESKMDPCANRATYSGLSESADATNPATKIHGLEVASRAINRTDGENEDRSNLVSLRSISKRTSLIHSASAPTGHQLHGLPRSGYPLKTKANHACLPEASWSLWPVSFLPYPFSPPQRLTMIIAYTILGFLLFSTMHLYHRLAVFDLQGNAFVRSPSYADTPGTMKSTLQSLELQLTELVELTGRVAQSLVHMTGEIREMRLTTGSSTSRTSTADQEPTCHSEPGPPV